MHWRTLNQLQAIGNREYREFMMEALDKVDVGVQYLSPQFVPGMDTIYELMSSGLVVLTSEKLIELTFFGMYWLNSSEHLSYIWESSLVASLIGYITKANVWARTD